MLEKNDLKTDENKHLKLKKAQHINRLDSRVNCNFAYSFGNYELGIEEKHECMYWLENVVHDFC